MTSIDGGAFWDCSSLTSIEIPNSVTSIGWNAFLGCSSLTSIEIPNSVTSIGGGAFYRCRSLTSIEIPNSVAFIGTDAFSECSSLNHLILEDGETNINLWTAFDSCPLEILYLGRNLSDKNSPFDDQKQFKEISFGKYVIETYNIELYNCDNLEVINSFNPNPPYISSCTKSQYMNVIVNIPIGSITAYQNDSQWRAFWNLEDTLPAPEILANEIILNLDNAEMNIDETLQLEATVLPEDVTDKTVIWTTSNDNIASVSEDGLVKAISVGETVIIATCGDITAECLITVLDDTGVESLLSNPDSKISIYTTDGILIKKDCTIEDLQDLSKGLYIIKTGNKSYKIAL